MPGDEGRYPASISHLPVRVRRKAIEIANALLEEGYDEAKAIRISIAKAKEWAGATSPTSTDERSLGAFPAWRRAFDSCRFTASAIWVSRFGPSPF